MVKYIRGGSIDSDNDGPSQCNGKCHQQQRTMREYVQASVSTERVPVSLPRFGIQTRT